MKQLSGLDASFLYMETASQFGHVSSLSIYERPDDPDYEPLSSWRHQIERRLHLLEPLRRRLRDVPFNLDHPYWVDDPDFDLDFHVRHTAVAPPGERRADRRAGGPHHRPAARPDAGRCGRATSSRGCPTIASPSSPRSTTPPSTAPPGPSCSSLMLDGDPEGDEIEPPRATTGGRSGCPATARCSPGRPPNLDAQAGAGRRAGHPHRPRARADHPQPGRGRGRQPGARRAARPARRGAQHRPRAVARGRVAWARCPPARAPRTPFNAAITAHRRFAFRSTSLELVKDIKNALGATVNDVVMAACAGGLRTWLEDHDALPDVPARRHGAGVDPHRRGDREVDEPGVEHLRRAAHRRARPAAAGGAGPRGDGRRQGALRRGARPTRSPTSPSSRRRPCSPGPCAPPPGSARGSRCR